MVVTRLKTKSPQKQTRSKSKSPPRYRKRYSVSDIYLAGASYRLSSTRVLQVSYQYLFSREAFWGCANMENRKRSSQTSKEPLLGQAKATLGLSRSTTNTKKRKRSTEDFEEPRKRRCIRHSGRQEQSCAFGSEINQKLLESLGIPIKYKNSEGHPDNLKNCLENVGWNLDCGPLGVYSEKQKSNEEGRAISPQAYEMISLRRAHKRVNKRLVFISRHLFDGRIHLPHGWGPLNGSTADFLRGKGASSSAYVSGRSSDQAIRARVLSSGSDRAPIPKMPRTDSGLVSCDNSLLINSHLRGSWEFIFLLHPTLAGSWRIVDDNYIKSKRETADVGDITMNDAARNHDIWFHRAFARLFTHYRSEEYPGYSEIEEEEIIYRIIADVFAMEQMTVRCRRTPIHCCLAASHLHPPTNNVIGTPVPGALKWGQRLAPILFAAHWTESDGQDARIEIANVLHPTMILLILYFLDTRKASTDRLPSWMFVFGAIYSRKGVSIYAHFPQFSSLNRPRSQGRWGARSAPLEIRFSNVFKTEDLPPRVNLTACFLKMRAHTNILLQRLQEWNGYKHAVDLLTQ